MLHCIKSRLVCLVRVFPGLGIRQESEQALASGIGWNVHGQPNSVNSRDCCGLEGVAPVVLNQPRMLQASTRLNDGYTVDTARTASCL